jgi:uncharacterized protein (DUF342 family)
VKIAIQTSWGDIEATYEIEDESVAEALEKCRRELEDYADTVVAVEKLSQERKGKITKEMRQSARATLNTAIAKHGISIKDHFKDGSMYSE